MTSSHLVPLIEEADDDEEEESKTGTAEFLGLPTFGIQTAERE